MQLKIIIDSVVKLPPTPQILPKLQTILRDPDSDLQDIISLLKVDAPMTAQIVRLSNSAYFGVSEPCHGLEDAINRLGFREVYKVVCMAATHSVLNQEVQLYKMAKGELLECSVACAVGLAEFGNKLRIVDMDSAYTTGLLHTIGKVVINQYYLKHGLEIYSNEEEEAMDPAMEKQLLGFNQAEAGAAILRKWNFTEDIVIPIEYQYAQEKAPDFRKLSLLLSLITNIIPAIRMKPGAETVPDPETLEELGIGEDNFQELLADTRESMKAVSEIFGTSKV